MKKSQTRRSENNIQREAKLLTACIGLGKHAAQVIEDQGVGESKRLWKAKEAQGVKDGLRQVVMQTFTESELYKMADEKRQQNWEVIRVNQTRERAHSE